jgi:hypothetical protein
MHDPLVLLHGLEQLLGDPYIRVGDAEVPFEVGDVDRSAAFLLVRSEKQGTRAERKGEAGCQWGPDRGRGGTDLERVPDDDGARKDVSSERGEFAKRYGWTVGAYQRGVSAVRECQLVRMRWVEERLFL